MYKSNRLYLIYRLSRLLLYSKHSSNQQAMGFTLLELVITIVIIGVLTAIAIPTYVATVDKFHYGKAKVQMSCLQRELIAYRMEQGYFPGDVGRDRVPVGIECFFRQNSNQVPFDSKYDYENWDDTRQGERGCVIQITFLGKNGERDNAANSYRYQESGFYEFSNNDDLVLSLGFYEEPVCVP